MKQYRPLTVKYVGKRGREINLTIDEFPDDQELIIAVSNPDYKSEWKTKLLDSYYEESLNDQRESRRDRHSQLSTFEYESAELFGVNEDIEGELVTKEWFEEIGQLLSARQKYLIRRCVIDGETYSSLAREEGKDESAIRKAVDRAKKKIKKYLIDRPN